MKILVINCGGSSFKYQLIDMPQGEVLAGGQVERLGKEDAALHYEAGGRKLKRTGGFPDHRSAITAVLDLLVDPENGALSSLAEVEGVGHRVVHAGERYRGSVIIDDDVIAALRDCIDLAPLHNPPNLAGIEICSELMPDVPHVAVFDNAFHIDLPRQAAFYAIPYSFYEKYRVRRYGFHGIAFRYMTERAAAVLGKPLSELKVVSLMLGSGTTANALLHGRSVDVSTGFTPTEGLVQSTRCGDVDPLVITYLMRHAGYSPEDIDHILNKESGWLGLSGVSNDLRDVQGAAEEGNERAQLALEVFTYRCRKYVGAYAAAMGGIDALVFSGGVGQHSAYVRQEICRGLEFIGLKLDPKLNEKASGEAIISSPDAKAAIVVVPADEESIIARDTYELVQG